ncbi:MAG: hypothetical protein ACI4VF_10130 [Lachnospirales bacterium]
MNKYETELKIIRSQRAYDRVGNIRISSPTEERINEVAEQLNIEFEEAAELLIDIGASNIDCWN